MSITSIVLILIVVINSAFLMRFVFDLTKNKHKLQEEKGSKILLAMTSPLIFFFSTLGISDFALSTILYRVKKLVSDENLPGTLNTQCVIPVAVMALAFIAVINVDIMTLIVCIVSQVAGAYVGPQFTVKLSTSSIKIFIGMGLIIAACFMVAGKVHWLPAGGTAIGLHGIKLLVAALCLFVFGALNNMGIGCYPLTMVTVYALGMNPAVTFPIMMGACAFSVPIGSMQFIKHGRYSRKITLFAATLGTLGVLIGVFFVKTVNVSMLQWVVAAIVLYSGINMLMGSSLVK